MHDDVRHLLKLQDLDQLIDAINTDLTRIPKLQEEAKNRLASDQKKLADAKSAYQNNEIAIKNVELEIGTRRTSIERLQTQQFETKKNDEFTKLGNEIINYKALVDELETKELELMEVADDLRQKIADAETSLARTQRFVDEEIAELQTRFDERKKELDGIHSQRTQQAEGINEQFYDIYTRLYKKRNGKAIVLVNPEHVCTSCNVQVTPTTYALAQAGTALAQCDNCGALLFT